MIPIEPVAASRVGTKTGQAFYKERYAMYRETVGKYIDSVGGFYDGFDEITTLPDGAVLSAYFYVKKPKTRKSFANTSQPDLDNYLKALQDVIFNGRGRRKPNEELFELGRTLDENGQRKWKYPRDSVIVGYSQVFKLYTNDERKVGTFVQLRGVHTTWKKD